MTTLVRVKRKHTDDPVEALVLSCKRAKKGSTTASGGAKSSASSKSASSEVKNVFRFAGTVAQKDQALPKHIEDVIQRGQLQYKTKGNIPAQVKAKQQQKQTSLNNRYRMVAKHRGISLEQQKETITVSNQDPEPDKPKKVSLRKKIVRRLSTKSANRDQSASVVNATAGSSKEVEDEARRLFNIYEVVQENLDDILSNKPAKLASLDDEDEDDVVMCNNVMMLREKLTISDGDTHRRDTDEYVYDLYYAESLDFDFSSEHVVLGLDPYNLSQPMIMEEEDDTGYGQDEDEDSNDENNWKNDYPDEDPDYFNQRHTDMFDEYLDDYRYGELSSDDDFNEYSDNKKHISRMMNYSDEVQNGADSDLELYG